MLNIIPFLYIGSKSNCIVKDNKIIDQKGKVYYGSSKFSGYKKIVEENITDIDVDILFESDCYEECLAYERKAHILNDVVMNQAFFNIKLAAENDFSNPNFITMKNINSGKISRVDCNHPDVLNGLWIGMTKGMRWYNDGKKSKQFLENTAPSDWTIGRIGNFKAHNKGKKVPDYVIKKSVSTRKKNNSYVAWNKGIKTYSPSEETRRKMSLAKKNKATPTMGTKWITNGVKNALIDPSKIIPNGWRYGQTKRKKKYF